MARRKKGDAISGWVNLDKPYDFGSTQAVGRVRRIFNAQKAGHAGTLDPLATGILPIALGEATKTVSFLMDADKAYRFTIEWGRTTASFDREGATTATSDVRPTPEQVAAVLPEFIGDILQVPPAFSAVKVDGERAYDLARAGETVELKAREISIYSARVVDAPGLERELAAGPIDGNGFGIKHTSYSRPEAGASSGPVGAQRRIRCANYPFRGSERGRHCVRG